MSEQNLQPSLLTPRQLQLLDIATAIELDESTGHGINFAARLFAQLSLPYKDPGDLTEWVRRNGHLTLSVTPGVITTRNGERKRGYPYGVIPRYLLSWMTTEAVQTRSRTLELGGSLSAFLRKLGLNAGGASGVRMHDQLRRLTNASMHLEDLRPQGERWSIAGSNVNLVSNYQLWFSKNDPEGTTPLIDSTITLSQEFYQSIIEAPVPLNPQILKALAGSPMRLDLYTWLAYRLSYATQKSVVPWRKLMGQFGAEYSVQRQFKAALERNLREVQILCPGANVRVLPSGLMLLPSREFLIKTSA